MVKLKSRDIIAVALCAALYAVVGYLTSYNLNFGNVAFWPAVFIPAIFAVLFGPWVGGLGGAIGIFIRDAYVTGNPLLSLIAGVTANFALFFIVGYLSRTKLDRKKTVLSFLMGAAVIILGLLAPTLIFPTESQTAYALTPITLAILFVVIMAVTIPSFLLITKYWKEFKNFGVSAIIGQVIGSVILSVGVWVYSLIFFSPTGTFTAPLSASVIPLYFVWTFATEIPFLMLLSPPIIKACYAAFPQLTKKQEEKSAKNENR